MLFEVSHDYTRGKKRNHNMLCSINQAERDKVFRLDISLKVLGVARPLTSDLCVCGGGGGDNNGESINIPSILFLNSQKSQFCFVFLNFSI